MFYDVFAMGMRYLSHLNKKACVCFLYRILDRVLGIFGFKRDGVVEAWRRLHNVELSDLYSLPNTLRVIK